MSTPTLEMAPTLLLPTAYVRKASIEPLEPGRLSVRLTVELAAAPAHIAEISRLLNVPCVLELTPIQPRLLLSAEEER